MTDKIAPIFIDSSPRLPLLNNHGRDFMGLENSSSPELVERTKNLFEYLNERLGFVNSAEGRENQKYFNLLLRSIYPEVMIDLADLVDLTDLTDLIDLVDLVDLVDLINLIDLVDMVDMLTC